MTLAFLASDAVRTGEVDHRAMVAPEGTDAAAVQLAAEAVDQMLAVTWPARVADAAGPKIRLTAPFCVLVVVVVLVTVTLPVVTRLSLPKVYPTEVKLVVLMVRVAAPTVVLTELVAFQNANPAVVPARTRKPVRAVAIPSLMRRPIMRA